MRGRPAGRQRPERPALEERRGSTPAGGSGGTEVSTEGLAASAPVTVCGNGVGLLGDASAACADTSSSGIIAPPPDNPPGQSETSTSGILGTPGSESTGTSGLLAAGLLAVRATRPDTARKGGGDR